ncbi:hypothetical protein GBF38_011491, partial [Nibea albiflora]
FSKLEHPLGLEADVTPQTKRPELRIELLTSENGALKQRCQEIVNQLTEADREIDRLKAELISQQGGKQHHLVMEELKRLKAELAENQANAIDREYYERELNEKSLRLHEALVTLEELGNTLKDTEKKLQLKEATLKGLGFRTDYEEEEEESEQVSREKLKEAENEIRMLREKLEMKTSRVEETVSECPKAGEKQVGDKGLIKQVVEKIEMKSEAINKELTETLEAKSNGLKQIVSDVKLAKDGKLLSLALASFDFGREQKQPSEYLLDALNEAYMFYVTT